MTSLKGALGLAVALGASALGLGACASNNTLPPNYAPTQAAISAADAVGAPQDPRASLHLKMAKDQLVQAQTLAKNGKDEEASLVLDRARTDAELALMVTRESAARADATRAKSEVDHLGAQ